MLNKFRQSELVQQCMASTCWVGAWTLLNMQLIKSLMLF